MPPHYEPTPQEIREACEEIQATWSEAERRKRAGLNETAEWSPDTLTLPNDR